MFGLWKSRKDARPSTQPSNRRGAATRGNATRAGVTFAARVTFEDVSRHFGGTLVLDHIDLDVPPGEILCLVGPSGCGKTTLLRIAARRPLATRLPLLA
jgi:iron(III) transport system ATP-binding protein